MRKNKIQIYNNDTKKHICFYFVCDSMSLYYIDRYKSMEYILYFSLLEKVYIIDDNEPIAKKFYKMINNADFNFLLISNFRKLTFYKEDTKPIDRIIEKNLFKKRSKFIKTFVKEIFKYTDCENCNSINLKIKSIKLFNFSNCNVILEYLYRNINYKKLTSDKMYFFVVNFEILIDNHKKNFNFIFSANTILDLKDNNDLLDKNLTEFCDITTIILYLFLEMKYKNKLNEIIKNIKQMNKDKVNRIDISNLRDVFLELASDIFIDKNHPEIYKIITPFIVTNYIYVEPISNNINNKVILNSFLLIVLEAYFKYLKYSINKIINEFISNGYDINKLEDVIKLNINTSIYYYYCANFYIYNSIIKFLYILKTDILNIIFNLKVKNNKLIYKFNHRKNIKYLYLKTDKHITIFLKKFLSVSFDKNMKIDILNISSKNILSESYRLTSFYPYHIKRYIENIFTILIERYITKFHISNITKTK